MGGDFLPLKLVKVSKFLIIFLLSLSGCSLLNRHTDLISIDAPMEITPLNAQNIESTLSVSVKATAKAEIPSSLQLLSRLTALKERDIVGDALYVFPKRSFKEGDTYEFTISVSSPEITDYQLSLLWGEEADRELKVATEKTKNIEPIVNDIIKKEVTLTQVETTPAPLECTKGICRTGITINGNLKNNDEIAKENIRLGVKLIDDTGKELGPEEILTLDGVILPPNSETPFEVGVTLPVGISASDASAKVEVK